MFTYLTISVAEDTILPWVNLTTLLRLSPFCPKSNTSMQPFSLNVYRIFRELSTSILTIGSSSYKAAFRNDGTKNDKALVEWFILLQCLPNHPNWAWKKNCLINIIHKSHLILTWCSPLAIEYTYVWQCNK